MSMKGNFARSILCSGTTSVDFGSYSSMVSVCCERGVSCCASKGRCDARIIEMAIAAIETRKATLRRKFIEAPQEFIVRRSRSLQIFPRALARRGDFFGAGPLAQPIRWTQIPGDRRFVVEAFCIEEQRPQMRIANLSDVLDLHMAQIVAFALEEFAGIFHASAARKAKRDMLLSDAKVAKRPVPFKNGD